jgi:hypothetical protein
MSLTINGTTNTLTAASGLTIAGNTAITGTLSASSTLTASTGLVWGTSTYQGYLSYSAGNVFIGNLSTGLVNFAVNSVTVAAMSSTAFEAVKPFLVSDTTDATSTTAASLKTAGGLAVAKKLYVGDNIVMTSGKGIDFSATANGSGTTASEVLSDYEEGTFTPAIAFGGAAVGVTYAGSTTGFYTKVGRQVTVIINLTLTNKGSSTGDATVTGLPFTTAQRAAGALSPSSYSFADYPVLLAEASATYAYVREATNAGVVTAITDADFQNGSTVSSVLTYFV